MKQKYKVMIASSFVLLAAVVAPLLVSTQASALPPTTVVAGNVPVVPAKSLCDGPTKADKEKATPSSPGCAGRICGAGESRYIAALNLGCKGRGNPIVDTLFAIIRFLSVGVGIVLVGSLVYAGIQFTSSRGDPKATADAINRIQATVFALLLFIFGYAILNYLIPAGILR